MPVSTTPRQKCAIAVQIKGLTSAILNLPSYVKSELDIKKINCGQPVFFQLPTRSQYGYLTLKRLAHRLENLSTLLKSFHQLVPSEVIGHIASCLSDAVTVDTERTEFVKGAKKIFRAKAKKQEKGLQGDYFKFFPMHPKDNTVSRSVKQNIWWCNSFRGHHASARELIIPIQFMMLWSFYQVQMMKEVMTSDFMILRRVKNMGRKIRVRLTMIMIR